MQRLRRYFAVLFPVVALLCVVTPAFGLTVDMVLAVVNGEVITLTDYGRFVMRTAQTVEKDTVNEQRLKALIEERLIIQEAKRKGYDVTEEEIRQGIAAFLLQSGIQEKEFETKITAENLTMADYRTLFRENIVSLKCIEKEVNAKVMVNSSDLARYYETHRASFMESPEKVLVMAIIIKLGNAPSLTEITDLKIRALKVYSEIINGETFERQVHKYAEETIKNRGGMLGEFERGALIPVLDKKIFSLKEGEVSGPVWTKDGVYILKIARKTEAVYAPFEKVKNELQTKAYEEKREEAFGVWMKTLWEKSSVEMR
ncbi:MAG: peptidylprolyl isomerase [Nitrospirae bacterium]|nr:peptidylprolyl isomerase [Nitrospirota bacterium]